MLNPTEKTSLILCKFPRWPFLVKDEVIQYAYLILILSSAYFISLKSIKFDKKTDTAVRLFLEKVYLL